MINVVHSDTSGIWFSIGEFNHNTTVATMDFLCVQFHFTISQLLNLLEVEGIDSGKI